MSSPNIGVYYWGKEGGNWGWMKAHYIFNGNDVGTGLSPIRFTASGGTYNSPNLVADVITATSLRPYVTVPIVIVNEGDAALEECGIDVISHFWAGEEGSISFDMQKYGDGFDNWWRDTAQNFWAGGSSTWYRDSAYDPTASGHTADVAASGNSPNTFNGIQFQEGWRYAATGAPESAVGSAWAEDEQMIYHPRYAGLAFCMNTADSRGASYGDTEVATVPVPSGSRLSVFGDPRTWYSAGDYRTGADGYTDAAMLENFGRLTSFAAANKNDATVWRMLHTWYTRQTSGSYRYLNPFGYYTIKNPQTSTLYDLCTTNSDYFQPKRMLRGFAYVQLYETGRVSIGSESFNNAYATGADDMSLGNNEGQIFGQYFCTIAIRGRYYG